MIEIVVFFCEQFQNIYELGFNALLLSYHIISAQLPCLTGPTSFSEEFVDMFFSVMLDRKC